MSRSLRLRGAAAFAAAAGACVVLAAPAAGAPAVRGVTYGGSTSTDDPIVLTLARDGKRITGLSQQFRAPCTSGERFPFASGPRAGIDVAANGRFAGTLDETVDLGAGTTVRVRAHIRGRVVGRRLTGASDVTLEVTDATGAVVDTCTKKVTFRAASSPERVFAGMTPQRRPVVVELTADGSRVKHFHIGWTAVCTNDGALSVGDTLVNFPVDRAGRFGDDFTQRYTEPEGEGVIVTYRVHGRITARLMRGTFRLRVTETTPQGVAGTCDTGALTFRATSG